MHRSILVLQHPNIHQCDLHCLPESLMTQAESTFNGTVLRIPVAQDFQLPETAALNLHQQHIDFAIIPDMAFSELALIVSDMDSTFITIECIDEIAAGVGLQSQISAITEQSMRGELDFTQSLRKRVSLLQGLPETMLQHVYDCVLKLSPGAEYLLQECRQHHVQFMLVSGGFTYFTDRLKHDYQLDYAYANQLECQNGKLTGQLIGPIIDAQAKAELLHTHQMQLNLHNHQILAMGDGANDIPMLQAAGIGIAYHAKPKTIAAADAAVYFGDLSTVRKYFR